MLREPIHSGRIYPTRNAKFEISGGVVNLNIHIFVFYYGVHVFSLDIAFFEFFKSLFFLHQWR